MQKKAKRKGAIDGMKDTLYSREHMSEIHDELRSPLVPGKDAKLDVGWSDGKIPTLSIDSPPVFTPAKKRFSFGAKFLFGAILFFVLATGAASYIFFVGGNTISPQNIDIQVLAPSVIDGGSPTTFQVIVNNRNQTPLQLVDMSVDYPDNTRDPADPSKPFTHELQSIGAIGAGEQVKRTANAVLYGQEGSEQKVVVTLQYSVPNTNSVFQKQAEVRFIIGSSPVSVSVQSPAEAISDQPFSMDVMVTSNAKAPIQNVLLEGRYPFGYSATAATPPSEAGSPLWRLGTLAPGQSKSIHLTGKIVGQDGDERVFRFLTGADADQTNTQIKVPFIVVPQTLTVHNPFITAALTLDGKKGSSVAIPSAKIIEGSITWQNNLTVPVSSVQVVLSLGGPMLDKTSVTSVNGFYQSENSTITWSRDQDSSLGIVPPGGTGTLQFTFKTLAPGSGGRVYANPTVNLDVAVTGVREGQTGVPQNISSAATMKAHVASAVSLQETALHFTGPFANAGPMPPVAEMATTYTILWTVQNSSNTVANTVVSATLPPYVQFVIGAEGVTYEKSSRTVTWTLGELKAGSGFNSQPRTAAFQVSFLPSYTQLGQSPPLTGDSKLTGQDRFAQVVIDTTAAGPTTLLQGDTGFQDMMGVVAPRR